MTLEERLKQNPPITSQANLKGRDPEIIGYENPYSPSKDLSKDEKALKSGRKGELGQGGAGHTPTKPYSDTFK